MKLVAHTPGAEPWIIAGTSDGLRYTLEEAFEEAASQTASDAGSDLLEEGSEHARFTLAATMLQDMQRELRQVGDRYIAPDKVLYTLEED